MGEAIRAVDVQEEQRLAELVHEVELGQEIVIVRDGRPVARIVPFQNARRLGILKGQITVPDDFDAPLPKSLLEEFEGQ